VNGLDERQAHRRLQSLGIPTISEEIEVKKELRKEKT
jgi:hypothetical protein